MKTFIIAVLSADGFISGADNKQEASTSWTSKEDKKFFSERTKQAGVVVFGYNTYKTIGKPLPDRLNVVYSSKEDIFGVEITRKKPKELIADLEARGYREIAIGGGSSIFTMFMEAGLVDKLYLSIEPVLFGQGILLFNKDLYKKLKLSSFEKLGENTVLLEYDVIK